MISSWEWGYSTEYSKSTHWGKCRYWTGGILWQIKSLEKVYQPIGGPFSSTVSTPLNLLESTEQSRQCVSVWLLSSSGPCLRLSTHVEKVWEWGYSMEYLSLLNQVKSSSGPCMRLFTHVVSVAGPSVPVSTIHGQGQQFACKQFNTKCWVIIRSPEDTYNTLICYHTWHRWSFS